VAAIRDPNWAMALLMFTCLCYGLFSSNVFAITQTLAGARAAGKWTAIQNGFGNLSGVAAPWLTGVVVERTGHFYLAFLLSAAIALIGAGMFVLGIGRVEPIRWNR
jgi:cyanate permease